MEPHLEKRAIALIITFLSFLFAVASIIPIFIPSILAYTYGFGSPRNKKLYGITRTHVLISAFIGELIFAIISSLPLKVIMEIHNYSSKTFWYMVVSVFVLNYLCSVIFYFRGTKQKIVTF
jgi:high-affinity nickel permease